MESTYWRIVKKTDTRARLLADRHYSRQTPGAVEFMPAGHNLVLLHLTPAGASDAVWGVNQSQFVRKDSFDYWSNTIFRNESGIRSSTLIREALAITKTYFDHVPADGMHSFVDASKVRGVKVRGKLVHGFCFMKSGFTLHPEKTRVRKLLRWTMSRDQLIALPDIHPMHEQMMFSWFAA